MTVSTNATGIHHISITVNDYERSKAFYERVFGYLGGHSVMEATGAPHKHEGCRMCLFVIGSVMIGVWEATPANRSQTFDRYSVGLHHTALAAPSREAVDELHRKLVADGVEILDPPTAYPAYGPTYYALSFADPDGMKLELVHT